MAMTQNMLKLHRVLGLIGGVFIFIAGATAVCMNHGERIGAFVEGKGPGEGPYAHSVLATTLDPRTPNRMLMGTTNGLFESLDGGKAWQLKTLPVDGDRVSALVTDPKLPGRLWAAVGGKHLLLSDNAGRTWTEKALPFKDGDAHVSTISLDAQGQPLLATEDGLYQADSNNHWTLTPRPQAPGVERNKRVQAFIAELHMGDVYGKYGIPVTDIIGISLMTLVLSGYFLFFQREYKVRMAKRRARLAAAAKAAKQQAAAESVVPNAPQPVEV